jgi:hypothetical protein
MQRHQRFRRGSGGGAESDEPVPFAPRTGTFWNATGFPGAELPLAALLAAPDHRAAAVTFLEDGRALLAAA